MIPGLSNNSRSLLTTIIVAGVAIGYFAFVFTPQQRAINTMRTELRDKQNYVRQTSHL